MRRVAVTGIGVVAPGGIGTKEFWELLTSGRTATRAHLAVRRHRLPVADRRRVRLRRRRRTASTRRRSQRMDRYVQFALVAAREAMQDSGLDAGRR